MTREPAVAGQFYSDDKKELERQIEKCFLHNLGPGKLPSKIKKGFLKAIISPHAGYAYSGMCASHGYKAIAESETADIYLFLGNDHYGEGSSISLDDWKTPLGTVRTDKEFAKELSEKTGIFAGEDVQASEHSIEVQLPFLQCALGKDIEKTKIVCVMISGDINLIKFSKKLKEIIEKTKKRITLIVSSDFTHYGRGYGYAPFGIDEEKLESLDKKAIELILAKDAKGFTDFIQKTKDTICGYHPILVLLNILGNEKGTLLKYYRSSAVSGDITNSVSYATITFK